MPTPGDWADAAESGLTLPPRIAITTENKIRTQRLIRFGGSIMKLPLLPRHGKEVETPVSASIGKTLVET